MNVLQIENHDDVNGNIVQNERESSNCDVELFATEWLLKIARDKMLLYTTKDKGRLQAAEEVAGYKLPSLQDLLSSRSLQD